MKLIRTSPGWYCSKGLSGRILSGNQPVGSMKKNGKEPLRAATNRRISGICATKSPASVFTSISETESPWYRTPDIPPERFWPHFGDALDGLGQSVSLATGETLLRHHDPVDKNVTMKSKRLGLTTVLGDKLTSDGDGGDGDSLVELPQVASSASVSSAPDPVLHACDPNLRPQCRHQTLTDGTTMRL